MLLQGFKNKLQNFFKGIFLILLLQFVCISVKAQSIDTALERFNNKASYEKAYIHFDNTLYAPGQTIWYKVYLMNGFLPSLISKNFYIDWYDKNGKLVSSSITPIVYSFSNGSYTIPNDFNGGLLHAVCYTKWMRNFDSTYFYHQSFSIVSNSSKAENQSKAYVTSLQFLPESGQMISGKLNVVAFKAVNSFGLPEKIQGVIKNSKGDSVASFKSIHDGMGKFQFIPNSNETYTAEWKDLTGIIHKTLLPEVQSMGVNLYLEPGKTNRLFHIQRTFNVPASMKQLTMIGQMNGQIQFKTSINLADRESLTSMLPISKLPSGILQIILFDATEKPIFERLLFVKNEDYKLKADVNIDTLNTTKRAKNVISISLQDTIPANLSISITDVNASASPTNSIVSHLLLQGDLAGNVFEPIYYFSSNADSVFNHLDLVMLTHGWSRYDWKEILDHAKNAQLTYSKDLAYQTIKGAIKDYGSRKSKKQDFINLIIVSKDSSSSLLTLPILEDGTFESANALLYDTTKIYYKLTSNQSISEKNISIENDLFKVDQKALFSTPLNPIDTIGFNRFTIIANEQRRIDSLKKSNTLKEVVVYTKQRSRIKELDKKYSTGLFAGEAAAAFDMSTLENASHTLDIFDFLDGKVPGLQFTSSIGGTIARVAEFRRGYVSFYLNENLINESEATSIDMNNVAYVKVFSPPGISGPNGSGGAIVIYTKRGGDIGKPTGSIPSGMDFKTNIGYAVHKEFYSPIYDEKDKSIKIEDARTTLLWNPWIDIDKNHQKVKIVFYNNDISNAFRLTIEGMDNRGKLLHFSKIIQ